MQQRFSAVWPLLVTTLAVLTMAMSLYLIIADKGLETASWAAQIVAMATLAAGLAQWGYRRWSHVRRTPTPEQMDSAARKLASVIRRELHDLLMFRLPDGVRGLRIYWREQNLGSQHDLRDASDLSTRDLHDLAESITSSNTPSRIAIVGAAGSGKSTFAIALAIEILKARQADGPLPIVLSLAEWDGRLNSLREWIGQKVVAQFPDLSDPVYGPNVGTGLLLDGRLIPILDDLDEVSFTQGLPSPLAAVLRTFQGDDSVVVIARTERYRAMQLAELPRPGLSELILQPVSSQEARAYIASLAGPAAMADWSPVMQELQDEESVIAVAFTVPLYIYLAWAIYGRGKEAPAGLVDASRNGPDYLQERLLDAYPEAALGVGAGTNKEYVPVVRARRWLEGLASRTSKMDSVEIRWWELPRTVPQYIRAALTFAIVGMAGTAAVLAVRVVTLAMTDEPWVWSAGLYRGGLLFAVVAVVAHAVPIRSRRGIKVQLRGRWRVLPKILLRRTHQGLGVSLATGLTLGVFMFAVSDLVTSQAVGFVFGGMLGLVTTVTGVMDDWLSAPGEDSQRASPDSTLRAEIFGTLWTSLLVGGVVGLTYTLGLLATIARDTSSGVAVAFLFVIVVASATAVTVRSAAWGYFVSNVWLFLRRSGPFRLMRFLRYAHHRGLLYQTGSAYRFRHQRLLERLAEAGSKERAR